MANTQNLDKNTKQVNYKKRDVKINGPDTKILLHFFPVEYLTLEYL